MKLKLTEEQIEEKPVNEACLFKPVLAYYNNVSCEMILLGRREGVNGSYLVGNKVGYSAYGVDMANLMHVEIVKRIPGYDYGD